MVWHLLQDRAGQGVCTEEGRAGHGADAPAGQVPPGPGKNQPDCGGTWGLPLTLHHPNSPRPTAAVIPWMGGIPEEGSRRPLSPSDHLPPTVHPASGSGTGQSWNPPVSPAP